MKVLAFANHKPILLVIGQPYATFDKDGAGIGIEFLAKSYVPIPGSKNEHALYGAPSIFILITYETQPTSYGEDIRNW
ncbi:MAG TPA: hypothetical protein EYG88_06325 [Desulfocapsa sulfexigens]|nr:hypothetical protein [Desulfocapsa sulfexigens]